VVIVRAAVLLVGVGVALPAQDPPPVFVEVHGMPPQVWQFEPFVLRVVVGCETEWLRSRAVPLFQRPLDLPFQVLVPWLTSTADVTANVEPLAASVVRQRTAVGGDVLPLQAVGTRPIGRHTYELFELAVRVAIGEPGLREFAPVQVRCAFATRFQEDFLRGRQPVDRQEATIAGRVESVSVRELPPVPAAFTGGVGEFEVVASCDRGDVRMGESFALRVEVRGTGNLAHFSTPSIRVPGFHDQGVVGADVAPDVQRFDRRAFVYDVLALRAGTTTIPALPFVVFSPQTGDYVTLMTAPVPLRVEPAAAELPARVRELIAADAESAAAERRPSWWWTAAVGLVCGALVGLRFRHQRRRRHVLLTAAAERALATAADGDAAALLVAFERVLAARVGVVDWSADGWARLPAGAATARLRALHADLDAARFGGRAPPRAELLAAFAALPPR